MLRQKGYFPEGEIDREIPIHDRTGKNLRLNTDGSIIPKGQHAKDKVSFKIGKVVWGQQSDAPEKVILIEEILWEDGRKELRFGYRTITHEKGAWWWGESALMTPIEDIQELLHLARKNGLLSI
ncbi:MAG: hypothetical protein RBG13Loki_1841 [Promethearchaeota archaeon CR_4]|nr:MAG: hypothetical protein RBG13Loki_1841 [Candidatus Lokiarchaeota archaeon CR_4]